MFHNQKNSKFDNCQFVRENQKFNNFQNNASPHNLAKENYQEIYDFLINKVRRKIPEAIGRRSRLKKKIGKYLRR